MDGIHLSKDGVTSGPYTADQVSTFLRAQEFSPSDHYWREGMESWQPIEDLKLEIPSEIPAKTEPKRVLPNSVAIIARLLIVMQVVEILDQAVFPLFTLIPGFATLPFPGLHGIPVAALLLPFIHPFFHFTLIHWLETVLVAAVAVVSGVAMLRGKNWGRIGALALMAFWLIRPFFFGLTRFGMAGQLIHCFEPLAIGFFLFRPAANRFFSETGPIEMSPRYGYGCIACLYLAEDLLFKTFIFPISHAHLRNHDSLLALNWVSFVNSFCFWIFPGLLAIFLLYFGLRANRFHAWKRDAAVVVGLSIFYTLWSGWSIRSWPVPPVKPLPPAATVRPYG